MTDHDPNCPHNHDPNPYTDNPTSEAAIRDFVITTFKLSALTVQDDPHLTGSYLASACMCMVGNVATGVGLKALAWEIGRMINVMSSGKEPTFSHVDHEDNEVDDERFMAHQMKAYLAAASTGELDRALNVVETVRIEAKQDHEDEVNAMAIFITNVMMSLAFTTRQHINDARNLFDSDD